jgi:hypothetical protein
VPEHHHARPHATDITVMVPHTITVLEARGVAVPDAVRERVMACTDVDQLGTWLRRAVTADTTDEVVRD